MRRVLRCVRIQPGLSPGVLVPELVCSASHASSLCPPLSDDKRLPPPQTPARTPETALLDQEARGSGSALLPQAPRT